MEVNLNTTAAWITSNTALIASLAGSATSAYFSELKTWRERVAAFGFGGICAIELSEPVAKFLHLGDVPTGYLMGFFGLNICSAILKGVRRFGDDADFWTLFRDFTLRLLDKTKDSIDTVSENVQQKPDKE